MYFKYFLFLFFISLNLNCVPQHKTDDLNNLSYHIVGLVENKPLNGGTGFFIKHKSKYFFVSAWHCFTFKNHLTEAYENPEAKNITSLIIYRNLADIRPDKFMRIETKSIADKRPRLLERKLNDTLLDVGAIEVQRLYPFEFDYYDITNATISEPKNDDNFVYSGFPVINGHQVDSAKSFYGKVISESNNRDEFIINIEGYTGCSGSPVFTIRNSKSYLIGVLFYALKDKTGKAFVCKAINIRQLKGMLYEN